MKAISVLVLFLFVWPFSSGKTFHMVASSAVPAASGTVTVKKGSPNRNTDLDIKVSNLAPPSKLSPAANVYILWVRPIGGAAANEGAIRTNQNLDGELNTATTSKNVDVFITAEQSATVTSPEGQEVLKAHITRE
ncbi:MAG TPA: hypothetical protein VFN62_09900 [Acidobacteriaceae bacterium]|nr:hypothetical protein [Acidobacteriaceae bacterium]